MSVNKVILIGNVGQDPKITYYEGGNCVAQLSLATTEKGYTLQNGTQIPDRTEWHNLIFRGRLGEIVEKYVHKGDKLYVEGKIRTRSYDDQGGIKRYVTEIFVDNMEMLTPRTATPGAAPYAPQGWRCPTAPTTGLLRDISCRDSSGDCRPLPASARGTRFPVRRLLSLLLVS